jgi:hypothetical protein
MHASDVRTEKPCCTPACRQKRASGNLRNCYHCHVFCVKTAVWSQLLLTHTPGDQDGGSLPTPSNYVFVVFRFSRNVPCLVPSRSTERVRSQSILHGIDSKVSTPHMTNESIHSRVATAPSALSSSQSIQRICSILALHATPGRQPPMNQPIEINPREYSRRWDTTSILKYDDVAFDHGWTKCVPSLTAPL